MFRQKFSTSPTSSLARFLALALLMMALSAQAFAQKERVLYAFQGGTDGANPQAGLITDKAGNLYGTTSSGGAGNCGNFDPPLTCGTVFELIAPTKPAGVWTESVLYRFQGGTDGASPFSGSLVFDRAGNLYGTTVYGGTGGCQNVPPTGCGTIFQLAPPSTKGGAWTETILYSFQAGVSDGFFPYAGLIVDRSGNVYGTAAGGGSMSNGILLRLSPPAVKGGAWTETILYNFAGPDLNDGATPNSNLITDGKGNLYGSTEEGGYSCGEPGGIEGSCGTVFELSPPTTPGGSWTESVLFKTNQWLFPYGLATDKHGNLYGAAYYGGTGPCSGRWDFIGGCGEVFQLTPPTTPAGSWSENTIYTFTGGTDGAFPLARPIVDEATGTLYGTASAYSESCPSNYSGCGTIFSLTPPATPGGTWTETTLHQFAGYSDGAVPYAGLLLGKNGIYGTTSSGGGAAQCANGCGTVFQIAP